MTTSDTRHRSATGVRGTGRTGRSSDSGFGSRYVSHQQGPGDCSRSMHVRWDDPTTTNLRGRASILETDVCETKGTTGHSTGKVSTPLSQSLPASNLSPVVNVHCLDPKLRWKWVGKVGSSNVSKVKSTGTKGWSDSGNFCNVCPVYEYPPHFHTGGGGRTDPSAGRGGMIDTVGLVHCSTVTTSQRSGHFTLITIVEEVHDDS